MRLLLAFCRFWYEFIVGDDWKIAAMVVLSLLVTLALVLTTSLSDAWLAVAGGVLLVGGFSASLAIDVRSPRR